MSYNSIYKKGQFVLLIVYDNMTYGFDFILFILSFIILLRLNLFHKQSPHRGLIMKHPKNGSNVISQKMCFSTSNRSWVNKIEGNSNKSSRKTLKSPQARAYKDLYKGRGKPEYEPEWVKDNGMERSPFGASWAKDDKLPFPSKYPFNYQNIKDPYNNRELIKKICKGNRVVRRVSSPCWLKSNSAIIRLTGYYL